MTSPLRKRKEKIGASEGRVETFTKRTFASVEALHTYTGEEKKEVGARAQAIKTFLALERENFRASWD